MPFQKGNDNWKNADAGRPFQAALKRALAQGKPERLRDVAEKLIDQAAAGEAWAIKELADRLDGKPKQQVEVQRTSDPKGMTLEELRDEIASALAAAGGSGASSGGEDQSGAVH